MSYQKQNFTNGEVLGAPQLNHIEDGIVDVESAVNETKGVVDKIIDPTLSVSGKAADAAKVGEAVGQVKEDLAYQTSSDSYTNSLLDANYTVYDTVYRDDGNTQGGGSRREFSTYEGEKYIISALFQGATFPVVTFLSNSDTILSQDNCGMTEIGELKNYEILIPKNCVKCSINFCTSIKKKVQFLKDEVKYIDSKSNPWKGKRIVWFGTSIPAGRAGHIGSQNDNTYPKFVGKILGATVYNEAIGSSCVHCKQPNRITDANPYGFIDNFEAVSRCLGNTVEEMTWVCDHRKDEIWKSGQISDADWASGWWREQILSYGYETKLDKYLTDDAFPDLFVFDHGHNDGFNSKETEDSYYGEYGEYSMYTFRGAMNFLIRRILNYNPRAKIVIISEYANEAVENFQVYFQNKIAEDWNLQILKQYEKLGWTRNKTINVKGYWAVDTSTGFYNWVSDVTSHEMTVFDAWVPDHIHPHSDLSNKALNKMADEIATWLKNQVSVS